MKQTYAHPVLTRTAKLFGTIFPLTSRKDFQEFQKLTSPFALGVGRGFIHNKRILDLGCGGMGAAIASFLRQGASKVVGVDVSAKNISMLKQRFTNEPRLMLRQGDICRLPKNIGVFDIVTSYGVIHHVINPHLAVRQAYRVLKRGGMVIVYLYGSGGILSGIIGRMRSIQKVLPLKTFIKFTKRWWRGGSFYLGDYLYVPVQYHYTWEDAVALFSREGFIQIERLPNTPVMQGLIKYVFPSQLDYTSLWSRIMFGTGGITLKAKKPL